MRVHGFTDEVTVCDCCGKRNLSGTFTVETDAGEVLNYGSVCVNKVYGRKAGESIKFEAKQIAKAMALPWDRAIDLYSRGGLQPLHAVMDDGAIAWNNSRELMARVVALVTRAKDGTRHVIVARAA